MTPRLVRMEEGGDPPPIAYGLAEGAAQVGLSPRTLRNLAAKGELELIKIGGRRLVRRADLEALIERAGR